MNGTGGTRHAKSPGPKITAARRAELIEAIRAAPNDLEAIGVQFDLGKDMMRRYASFARAGRP